MVRDGIELHDEDRQIIVNQHSFCELIKYLLVELVGISYEEASDQVEHSFLDVPVSSASEADMLSREIPYYWTMLLYYGNHYWKRGVPARPENIDEYTALENRIRKKHHLNRPFVWCKS